MTMNEPNGADHTAGWHGPLPAFPEGSGAFNADLVAQIANQLFAETPDTPPEATALASYLAASALPGSNAPIVLPVSDVPLIGGGPAAPAASGVPTLGDVPLDAATLLAPAVPSLGGGPSFPLAGGVLAPDTASWGGSSLAGAIPATAPGLPTAGQAPVVGDGAFFSAIPHQLDLGLMAAPGNSVPVDNRPGDMHYAHLPIGEADLLHLGNDSLAAGGLPSPVDSGAPFYFLPAPPSTAPETSEAFDMHAVRRDFPALHQKVHGKPLIWLDNAATTHKPQSVIDTLSHFYAHDNSNIHRGAHTLADRATNAYEEARQKVQFFLGASSPAEIIFTRNTTEAINLVAHAYGRKFVGEGDEVLVSTLEHHSNIVPWQFLCQQTGATLRVVPIDEQGQVLLDEYERMLGPRTRLVALAHVSNVLGTVLPVSIMTQMAHQYGARVLVDGAQAAPHLPVNVEALGADFYAFSGHKLFGPTGIGILYGKRDLLEEMPPWQAGGSMIDSVTFDKTTFSPLPAKFEAGTAHIAGAVGLGAAIDYLQRLSMESIAAYEEGLMAYATSALSTIPGLRQIGTTPGKVGALAFVIPGVRAEDLGRYLDREGIAVRAGHHCAQPTLQRYGLTAAVRPSISLYNTPEEIDTLVATIRKAQHDL